MMKILVCSQQRTGSNMLRTMLAKQEGLRVGGEVCNGDALKWWPTWTDEPIPPTLLNTTLRSSPVPHVREGWKAFDVWNLHDRWQWNPNWYREQHVDTIWHDALLDDPTFKVIWLGRDDKIAQAMSFVIAHKTTHWIKYLSDSNDEQPRFTLNPKEILLLTQAFTKYRVQIRRLFAPHKLPDVSITYEELSARPMDTLKRVTDFLGIPCQICEPDTRQTYATPLDQLVTNYHEIVAHINGT